MARSRDFDQQEVLSKALDLFWSKGYSDTSVQDLVDHLGIGRGSLYNAYGSKHDLFLEALENYYERRKTELMRQLKGDTVLDAIRHFMYSVVDEIVQDQAKRGCLIVNTMTQDVFLDEEVARIINRSEKMLIQKLTEVVTQVQENSDWNLRKAPRNIALYLSNTIKGLRVLAKAEYSREELESIIDIALIVFE